MEETVTRRKSQLLTVQLVAALTVLSYLGTVFLLPDLCHRAVLARLLAFAGPCVGASAAFASLFVAPMSGWRLGIKSGALLLNGVFLILVVMAASTFGVHCGLPDA